MRKICSGNGEVLYIHERGYQKFEEKGECGEERKTKKDTERT